MNISRADFEKGRANVYDEIGRKVRSFPCDALVGWGRKGIVVKRNSLYGIIDMDCRQRLIPTFQFNKEKYDLHDDYLMFLY
ncbi:MAG TPA: hypothetical protein DDY72_02730 [Verrucomicrobia bacterium]|nr:hypothetical protein [Verrucomicrobiota bacterium]